MGVDEGEMKGIPDYRFSSNCSTVTVALPSAAKVMPSADSDARCRGFESLRAHQEPVTQKMSQALFFVVSRKISKVDDRFSRCVL